MPTCLSQVANRPRTYLEFGLAVRSATAVASLALSAIASAPAVASAQIPNVFTRACNVFEHTTSVFLGIAVNGQCVNLSNLVVPGSKAGTVQLRSSVFVIGGNRITLNAFWNADPFITFDLTTENLVAGSQDYSLLFGTPVIPGAYRFAGATLTGSIAPGQNGGTVTNTTGTTAFLSGYGTLGVAATNLAIDLGTGPCTATNLTVPCGVGARSNTFAPTQYDNLEAILNYTQTGVGSTASFSGRIDLLNVPPATTVPEPSTYALMASGLVAVAFVSRRRKQVER
jgi:hypothetical protein